MVPLRTDSSPPIKFGRVPPNEGGVQAPMFSTQSLRQTSMGVTTNFQGGKILPKRNFYYYYYFITYAFS